MPHIAQAILAGPEEKVIEEYISSYPDKFYRYGRQPRKRKLITSFGPTRYRLARLYDRQSKKVFSPLIKKLSILPHKHYQRGALEAAGEKVFIRHDVKIFLRH
ncbi:MAG: hypothetical protein J7L26_02780 [Candidatus Aminicenantes bacterium]|nr:hypothetical protein [Candidatus Aminicenantes bacterium]